MEILEEIGRMTKDIYDEFGIPYNATAEDIKKRYYHLMILYHPDKNQGATNAEEINHKAALYGKINNILKDDELRQAYDTMYMSRKKKSEDLKKLQEDLDQEKARQADVLSRIQRESEAREKEEQRRIAELAEERKKTRNENSC